MKSEIAEEFLERWQLLAGRLGIDDATSAGIGTYLLAQYSHESRHYHSTYHIVSMLRGLDGLRDTFAQPDAAELAIFFHDVIYDVSRKDNEEQSAIKMDELLRGKMDGATLDKAASSIRATASHEATGERDTDLLIDLDMAILGQPWAAYERYASNVMKEYVPTLPEPVYREKRPEKFLRPTSAKDHIYITPEFRHLDAPAVRNMQREIEILSSGKSFKGKTR